MLRLSANIVAIISAAMFAGLMLAIGVILGDYWKSLAPDAFLDWFGPNQRFIMHAVPMVVVPTLLGLATSIWLDWAHSRKRLYWLAALACITAVLALTLTYFTALNGQFAARTIAEADIATSLEAWRRVHVGRIALAVAAAVLGILALQHRQGD